VRGGEGVGSVLNRLRDLRMRIGPLWWHGGLQFLVSRLGDGINFYIGMILVPAAIDGSKLGAVLPLSNIPALLVIPLSVVLQALLKYLTIFRARGETGKIRRVMRDMFLFSVGLSVLTALVLLTGRGFIMHRLKLTDPAVMWMVGAVAVASCWSGVALTAVQGTGKYYRLTFGTLAGPVARLVLCLLLLRGLQVTGYFAAQAGGMAVMVLALVWGLGRKSAAVPFESYTADLRAMWKYLVPVGVMMLLTSAQGVIEPWIVRQRLPEADSAAFYIVSMFGNMPAFVCSALMPFLFPMVSDRHERGESTSGLHGQALAGTAVVSIGAALVLGLAARPLLDLYGPWRAYAGYAPYVWLLGLSSALRSLAILHGFHEAACRRFGFLKYYVPVMVGEVALLCCLMGWGFFKPWLPGAAWRAVDAAVRPDLSFVVALILLARGAIAAGIAVESLRLRAGARACAAAGG